MWRNLNNSRYYVTNYFDPNIPPNKSIRGRLYSEGGRGKGGIFLLTRAYAVGCILDRCHDRFEWNAADCPPLVT